jgi:hypothetical protein
MSEALHPSDVPRDYWTGVPCGHPPDPVALWVWTGHSHLSCPVCHCGWALTLQNALPDRPEGASGPIVPCVQCGCYVAVPDEEQR